MKQKDGMEIGMLLYILHVLTLDVVAIIMLAHRIKVNYFPIVQMEEEDQ